MKIDWEMLFRLWALSGDLVQFSQAAHQPPCTQMHIECVFQVGTLGVGETVQRICIHLHRWLGTCNTSQGLTSYKPLVGNGDEEASLRMKRV